MDYLAATLGGFIVGLMLGNWIAEKRLRPLIPRPDEPATDRQRAFLAGLQRENPGPFRADPNDPNLTISQASLEIDRIKRG